MKNSPPFIPKGLSISNQGMVRVRANGLIGRVGQAFKHLHLFSSFLDLHPKDRRSSSVSSPRRLYLCTRFSTLEII